MRRPSSRRGFVLITVLAILVVLAILAAAYFFTTQIELTTSKANADSTTGFYAAEAGLNLRGEDVRQIFQGYNRPSGSSPGITDPCIGSNLGSGDFACRDYDISQRTVQTYVVEDAANGSGGTSITIGPNEQFSGLNAVEYRYRVFSEAIPANDTRPEAIVEMVFRSRLVPMFQFAAFYNKDLEILPGPDMTINGRVHANGDLYLNANNTLDITGQVTVATRQDGSGGDLYRRRKNNNDCTGTVRVDDIDSGTNPDPALSCGSSGPVPDSSLGTWNNQIQTGLGTITVPPPEQFDPGQFYWQQADLAVTLVLKSDGTPDHIMVPNRTITAGVVTENAALTNDLLSCPARDATDLAYSRDGTPPDPSTVKAVDWSNSFYDNREDAGMTMLEIDMGGLLDCLHQKRATLFNDSPSTEKDIDDTSGGGLVLYFSVVGPDSKKAANDYGVRLRDGRNLSSTAPGAPAVKGVTVVSDQAAFIQGDYNVDGSDWKPASFLTDTLNVLSNAWDQAGKDDASRTGAPWSGRGASSTEINAAFLSGTDTTGGVDGTAGQGGEYNGGLENYPRFHENWSGKTLKYRGSFVSLGEPQHKDGLWHYGSPVYEAPDRDWGFDTRFYDAGELPPLAPRFVYLKQERFVRNFER